jgi:hypothetical protein
MHICSYLIVVIEAMEIYLEEDVTNALAKKVLTGMVAINSPTNKASK